MLADTFVNCWMVSLVSAESLGWPGMAQRLAQTLLARRVVVDVDNRLYCL